MSYGLNKCVDIQQRQDFSLLHSVHTISGVHPASYPIDTRSFFSGVKWQGCNADNPPPASVEVKNGRPIPLLPMHLQGVVFTC
jgi:hypothetical protein